jgi:hypothetical protein
MVEPDRLKGDPDPCTRPFNIFRGQIFYSEVIEYSRDSGVVPIPSDVARVPEGCLGEWPFHDINAWPV